MYTQASKIFFIARVVSKTVKLFIACDGTRLANGTSSSREKAAQEKILYSHWHS